MFKESIFKYVSINFISSSKKQYATFRYRGQGRICARTCLIQILNEKQIKFSRFETRPKVNKANLDAYISIMNCRL